MSKELAVIDYKSPQTVKTLMATVAQGLNIDEFQLFAEHCKGTGLNPFKKEVWAIKAGGRLQIMTGNQGFHTIANSHPQYDGMETGFVGQGGEYLPMTYPKNDYIGAWAKVYRKDRRIPLEAVAMLNEYDKGHGNWKTMRRIMIVKCAESLALRKAFPQELNGLYTQEEMPNEFQQPIVEVVRDASFDSNGYADTSTRQILDKTLLKTADEVQQEQQALDHDHEAKLGFGKYRDLKWSEVNDNYLQWLTEQKDGKFKIRALAELERRATYSEDPFNGDNIPEEWEAA